jgi:hypothetical protein
MFDNYLLIAIDKNGKSHTIDVLLDKDEDVEIKFKKYFDKHEIISYNIADKRQYPEEVFFDLNKVYNN